MKNQQKMNERELSLGLTGTRSSWHSQYDDSAWVFVGGLPYELTEGDVLCIFSQCGEIVNVNLVRDKDTGKSKGFAFICYEDQRSTILAVDNMNGAKVLNRAIRVDHKHNYQVPKERGDEDELTKLLREKGCAPASSILGKDEEFELLDASSGQGKTKKKKKKKDKKLKKNKKRSSIDESMIDSDIKPEVDEKLTNHKLRKQKELNSSPYDDRETNDRETSTRVKENDHNRHKLKHAKNCSYVDEVQLPDQDSGQDEINHRRQNRDGTVTTVNRRHCRDEVSHRLQDRVHRLQDQDRDNGVDPRRDRKEDIHRRHDLNDGADPRRDRKEDIHRRHDLNDGADPRRDRKEDIHRRHDLNDGVDPRRDRKEDINRRHDLNDGADPRRDRKEDIHRQQYRESGVDIRHDRNEDNHRRRNRDHEVDRDHEAICRRRETYDGPSKLQGQQGQDDEDVKRRPRHSGQDKLGLHFYETIQIKKEKVDDHFNRTELGLLENDRHIRQSRRRKRSSSGDSSDDQGHNIKSKPRDSKTSGSWDRS